MKKILILGGYGGVGKKIVELLFKYTKTKIIVAGRRLERAEEFANKFNSKRVESVYLDTSNANSLEKAFKNIDLIVVCTTSPEDILNIARIAIKLKVDYLDIQFEPNVYYGLKSIEKEINKSNKLFITQAGFHPGLPAVFIREGAKYFDEYKKANIFMTMNSRFEKPESTIDLVNSVRNFNSHILKEGIWRDGTYKDVLNVDFEGEVGDKKCYPIDMEEIRLTAENYKLTESGVYVSGFNWFIDNLVFPLIIISHKIKKNSLTKFFSWLIYFGVNNFSKPENYVRFMLKANGKKNRKGVNLIIRSWHNDPFLFTAIPVVACIKQYLNNNLAAKGLHMMGHVVDTSILFEDMKKMGIKIEIKF